MRRNSLSAAPVLCLVLAPLGLAQGPGGPPPPPPPPPPVAPLPATSPAPLQNPTTAEKAVLGKVLFFEEQLSSDNTTACATCHINGSGGGDPRSGPGVVNPGPDATFGTPDDRSGSPGVSSADADDRYFDHTEFGFGVQVTGRAAPTMIGSGFFDRLFWDGRAEGPFVDPVTGVTEIPAGGALENQAVGPPVSEVEMGHLSRDWPAILEKLEQIEPLRLASNLTPDIVTALSADPTYPELFANAFGTPEITATRVAMALAAYQRTLVPDQTPWDAFNAGNVNALNDAQRRGLAIFSGPGQCANCHTPPLFSDGSFRNVGVRPPFEDGGRQEVTGNFADRGEFKVPTLRNVALREVFFHNGQFTTLGQVVNFYDVGGVFMNNIDPLMALIGVPPGGPQNDVIAFLTGGLTDPRVANELPPFDRPTLFSETPAATLPLLGGAVPGSGGFVPEMLANNPPGDNLPGFKLGLANARGGSVALLTVRTPAGLDFGLQAAPGSPFATTVQSSSRVLLPGTGAGQGFTTYPLTMPEIPGLSGQTLHAQWHVFDPGAPGNVARSEIVELVMQ